LTAAVQCLEKYIAEQQDVILKKSTNVYAYRRGDLDLFEKIVTSFFMKGCYGYNISWGKDLPAFLLTVGKSQRSADYLEHACPGPAATETEMSEEVVDPAAAATATGIAITAMYVETDGAKSQRIGDRHLLPSALDPEHAFASCNFATI